MASQLLSFSSHSPPRGLASDPPRLSLGTSRAAKAELLLSPCPGPPAADNVISGPGGPIRTGTPGHIPPGPKWLKAIPLLTRSDSQAVRSSSGNSNQVETLVQSIPMVSGDLAGLKVHRSFRSNHVKHVWSSFRPWPKNTYQVPCQLGAISLYNFLLTI